MTGRQACERLMAAGVLAKDTHGSTIRLAPPLVVTEDDIRFAMRRVRRGALRLIVRARPAARCMWSPLGTSAERLTPIGDQLRMGPTATR